MTTVAPAGHVRPSPAALEERKASVRALVQLISTAAEDAMAAWEDHEGTVPMLDDVAEDKAPSPPMLRAMRLLDGSCFQLSTMLMPMYLSVMSRSWAPLEAACMRVAVEAKVVDVLDGKPKGVHVSEIAKATGLDQNKLCRILRALTVKHCFREVSKDVFANNRVSYSLRSACPSSAFAGVMLGETNQLGYAQLWEALSDPEYGPSQDLRKAPFSYGLRNEMPDATIFEYYAKHQDKGQRFNRAMTSFRLGDVQEFFPVASLPAGTSWVDVGGGFGHVLLGVAQANPKLKLTLQDQQHVLDQAKQFLEKEYPQGLENKNPRLVPVDFLKGSPVKDQDIYYMRFIIHDWPDEIALVILKNVAKAMKPSSRLLIHDFCLTIPSDNSSSSNVNALAHDAPPPLLPNYGAGGARPFLMDINIMIAANAKERSAEDVARLADRAGLEYVRFWDCVETGMNELKLKT